MVNSTGKIHPLGKTRGLWTHLCPHIGLLVFLYNKAVAPNAITSNNVVNFRMCSVSCPRHRWTGIQFWLQGVSHITLNIHTHIYYARDGTRRDINLHGHRTAGVHIHADYQALYVCRVHSTYPHCDSPTVRDANVYDVELHFIGLHQFASCDKRIASSKCSDVVDGEHFERLLTDDVVVVVSRPHSIWHNMCSGTVADRKVIGFWEPCVCVYVWTFRTCTPSVYLRTGNGQWTRRLNADCVNVREW